MSSELPELALDQEPAAPDPKPAESAGCTLGIGMALMLLVLCSIGILALRVVPKFIRAEVSVEELVAQTFKQGEIPFGLLESGSDDYLGRAKVLRMARPGLDADRGAERLAWEAAAEMLGEKVSSKPTEEPEEGTETEEEKPKGMLALKLEPGSLDPDELLLVEYHDVKMLIAAFKTESASVGFGGFGKQESDADVSRHLERWKKNASHAWKTTLTRDKVKWDGWEADFHIERAFRKGGAWSDSVKLNLGLGERNLALFVHWPDGYVVTRKDVARVASSVKM